MHDALDKPEKVDGRASNVATAGSAQLPIMLPATGLRRRAAVVLAMDMRLPEGQEARATRVASFNRWTVDASSVYVCTSKDERPLIPLLERVVAYDAADPDPPIDEAADKAPLRSNYLRKTRPLDTRHRGDARTTADSAVVRYKYRQRLSTHGAWIQWWRLHRCWLLVNSDERLHGRHDWYFKVRLDFELPNAPVGQLVSLLEERERHASRTRAVFMDTDRFIAGRHAAFDAAGQYYTWRYTYCPSWPRGSLCPYCQYWPVNYSLVAQSDPTVAQFVESVCAERRQRARARPLQTPESATGLLYGTQSGGAIRRGAGVARHSHV